MEEAKDFNNLGYIPKKKKKKVAVDTRIKKRPLKNVVKFTFHVLYSKYTKFPILCLLDLSYFFVFIQREKYFEISSSNNLSDDEN